jgi:GcrA cell cycle regulator
MRASSFLLRVSVRTRTAIHTLQGPKIMSANRATSLRQSWDSERVELLKHHFNAGLSCSQIAREIGVTRNAVIGKMNRLGLSRPKEIIAAQAEHRRAARLARPKGPSMPRPKRSRLSIFTQQNMLAAAFPGPRVEDVPIANGCGCTLLELSREKCRWPVNEPGAADFRYCGNAPVEGMPYCLGHARIAYRPAGRRRAVA